MINGKSVLAIVPARGGSKGLPRKNILPLAGKPLIVWTIDAAIKSKFIDRCIVSTDDTEISECAISYGAEIPFRRPANLSTDSATTADVVLHALSNIPEKYDLIILLQPTSPLRTEFDIDNALENFIESKADSLVSVTELEHPTEWSFHIDNNKIPSESIYDLKKGYRRQDYEKKYRLNGAIYICKSADYEKSKSFFMDNVAVYKMNWNRSVDIDSKIDFYLAEMLIAEKS